MKILKSMGIIVLVVTGVSLGLGSVSALASRERYSLRIKSIILGIDENGEARKTDMGLTPQWVYPGDEVKPLEKFSAFRYEGFIAPNTAPLVGREVFYHGSKRPTTVEIYFEDVNGQVISHRTTGGGLTLGGVADLTPPQKFQLVNQDDRNQIVLQYGETRHIQIKPISGSEQTPSNAGEGQTEQKPTPNPGAPTPSAKPQPAPGTGPSQPTKPTTEDPKPQPAPNPAKPHPSKPTAPTLPTSPTPQPQPATPMLPTQPVVSHPALPANPTHHSLTTNLPAATKPRPWAHHSAVDLWEAAPDTADDTATTPSQATDHPHTSPATSNHHQAAHAANQPLAASAPAKSPAKTPSAAKRLPQTNDRPNGLAIAIGSLLLSFTGIWRNRRIHQ